MAHNGHALFSLLKAFKLFLVPPLHHIPCWLSSLLQRKQSSVMSSSGFKGDHSLPDLLYFLAIFAVLHLLGEAEGMHGI